MKEDLGGKGEELAGGGVEGWEGDGSGFGGGAHGGRGRRGHWGFGCAIEGVGHGEGGTRLFTGDWRSLFDRRLG